MTALPADIPTGLVTGQFYFVSEDAVDADTDPELTVVSGNVLFNCSVPLIRLPGKPAGIVPLEFKAKFDATGQLVSASDPSVGLELPATDSPLTNPTGFTWTVTFDLVKSSNGHTVRGLASFDIQVPAGGTVDLITVMPVSTSPGVITVQGPPGDDGAPGDPGLPGEPGADAPKHAFYPESYGADPTGVANSRGAVQAAMDAANAVGGGVVLLDGTYRLDSQLIPKDHVTLQGVGWGRSILKSSNLWPDGASILMLGRTAGNPLMNFTARDIKFDLTDVPTTNQAKALFVTYSRNMRFENNWVLNSTATGIGADFIDAGIIRNNRVEGCGRYALGDEENKLGCSGIGIGTGAWGSEATLVEGNFVINPVRYGIFLEVQSFVSEWTYGVKVVNNYVIGAYRGISSNGVAHAHIIGNHVENCREDGIVIAPGNAGGASFGDIVANNTVRNSARYGMKIDFGYGGSGTPPDSGKFMVVNNQFIKNVGVGLKIITSAQMKAFQVTGNRIAENGSIGMDVTGGGLLESDFMDNRITDNTGVGIRILANCTRLRIRGNRSGDTRATGRTQTGGVQLSSVITDSVIEGNDFRNTSGPAVDIVSTPVRSIIRNNHGYGPDAVDSLGITASPQTYTVGPRPEQLNIIGGTWTNIQINGVTWATGPGIVDVVPNDVVTFNYTAAPTAIKRRKL